MGEMVGVGEGNLQTAKEIVNKAGHSHPAYDPLLRSSHELCYKFMEYKWGSSQYSQKLQEKKRIKTHPDGSETWLAMWRDD